MKWGSYYPLRGNKCVDVFGSLISAMDGSYFISAMNGWMTELRDNRLLGFATTR